MYSSQQVQAVKPIDSESAAYDVLNRLALSLPVTDSERRSAARVLGFGELPPSRMDDREWWALQTRRGGFNPAIPTPAEVLDATAPQDPDGIAWCDDQPTDPAIDDAELGWLRGYAGLDTLAAERAVTDRLSDGYPLY
jgi:hypothetical protein